MSSIPFGPEHKDGPWSWGAWLFGFVGFIALYALMRLDLGILFDWRLFFLLVAGLVFSARSGRAFAMGRTPTTKGKTIHPTVDVRGQSGSTYVLMEPAKTGKPRVKPREFSPGWWATYSVAVRAPVALGDFILTVIWRGFGGVRGTSAGPGRTLTPEHVDIDYHDRQPRPDGETF